MHKEKKSSVFTPLRWLSRMFFGASKELTAANERYDSPSKIAVKQIGRAHV